MARCGALLIVLILKVVHAEILTPPYFNLAQGKKITATATCGDEGPELYCKLAGANTDADEHVIQGQVFFCLVLAICEKYFISTRLFSSEMFLGCTYNGKI